MKKIIQALLARTGYRLEKTSREFIRAADIEPEFLDHLAACGSFSMTSPERLYALYQAVRYILDHDIPGDLTECGVWRGGSAMLIARMLVARQVRNRTLWLYDTFEGMSAPTDRDVDFRGGRADSLLEASADNKETSVWCLADLRDVQRNMASTGIPEDQVRYVRGKVEETLPATMPGWPVALLRLDTDWYESTRHELTHLYPRLSSGGVLIVDDYGHWQGCRQAVEEYFAAHPPAPLLARIDYTGRLAIKR